MQMENVEHLQKDRGGYSEADEACRFTSSCKEFLGGLLGLIGSARNVQSRVRGINPATIAPNSEQLGAYSWNPECFETICLRPCDKEENGNRNGSGGKRCKDSLMQMLWIILLRILFYLMRLPNCYEYARRVPRRKLSAKSGHAPSRWARQCILPYCTSPPHHEFLGLLCCPCYSCALVRDNLFNAFSEPYCHFVFLAQGISIYLKALGSVAGASWN